MNNILQIVHDTTKVESTEAKSLAAKRYDAVLKSSGNELLVSGSDDFTLFLWNPAKEKKHLARMTGKLFEICKSIPKPNNQLFRSPAAGK